jgi:hypothetical protein
MRFECPDIEDFPRPENTALDALRRAEAMAAFGIPIEPCEFGRGAEDEAADNV